MEFVFPGVGVELDTNAGVFDVSSNIIIYLKIKTKKF
jgi:hypothetical protein